MLADEHIGRAQPFELGGQWFNEAGQRLIPPGENPPYQRQGPSVGAFIQHPPGYTNPLGSFGDIPIVGPWIARVGRIIQLFNYPCVTTPEAWFKGFFHAAPIAFWAIFHPSSTDYLAERFGSGHGSRRGFSPPSLR